MKSMRAKHSPQRSPLLEMRERQAMQTGVNSKLPTTPNADSLAGAARSRPSFVSLTRTAPYDTAAMGQPRSKETGA